MEEKEIQEKINHIVVNILGIDDDEFQLKTSFGDIHADELDVFDITIALEKEFEIAINEKDEFPFDYDDITLEMLVELIKNKLS